MGTPIRGKTHAASLDGTEAVPLSPDSFTTTQEIADLGSGGTGLPPQWSDGGNGDVTATVDDPTKTPIEIVGLGDQEEPLLIIESDTPTGTADLLVVRKSVGEGGREIFTIDDSGQVDIDVIDAHADALKINALDDGNFGEGKLLLITAHGVNRANVVEFNDVDSGAQLEFGGASGLRFRNGTVEAIAGTGQTAPLLLLKDEDGNDILPIGVAPNAIAGSGTMAEIVLPSDTSGVAIRVEGEAQPRMMIGVDGEGVIYFGNGVDDAEVMRIALGSVYDYDTDSLVPTLTAGSEFTVPGTLFASGDPIRCIGIQSINSIDPSIGLVGTAPNESWFITAGGTDGFIIFGDQARSTSQIEFSEMGDPGTGPGFPTPQADALSLFARDNGAGKSELAIEDEDGTIAPLLRLFPTLPADADLPDSGLALALDDTPGATALLVKAKDSAGTVRTGSIPLT